MRKIVGRYVDYESQYLIAMTPEHHIRQLGGAFVFSYLHATTLATSGVIYMEIITPSFEVAAKEIALKPLTITCDQLIKFEIFEGSTATNGTTSLTISNQNRESPQTPTLSIFSDPTNISGGTLLRTRIEGTGSNSKPVGIGVDANELGWQLKPNTKYIAKFTNIGTQTANVFSINGQFFEITRTV